MKLAIEGTCLCGAVKLGAARMPRQVTQCNCSVCRKYGTLWAYFREPAIEIGAPRRALARFSRREHGLEFVHCAKCGCVICWKRPGKRTDRYMGVNARLLDHAKMANVPIKVLDGDKTWRTLGTYKKPGIWISPKR